MATIILVHGRSQQFEDSAQLERRFERALIAGLTSAGISTLPKPEEMLFPFYGHLYQGFGLAAVQPTSVREKQEQLAFERDFGAKVQAKLARMGKPLDLTSDQAAAGAFDPFLSLLDRIPGFGSGVVRLLLRDVFAYQHNNNGLRDKTMAIVKEPIVNSQGGEIVLIAHSLGTIVTYDILNTTPGLKISLYVTIGAPLGVDGTVRDFLLRDSAGRLGVPAGVQSWANFADPDDVVALDETLADDFLRNGSSFVRDISVRNPAEDPHSSDAYLQQRELGRVVGSALNHSLGAPAPFGSATAAVGWSQRTVTDERVDPSNALRIAAETVARSGRSPSTLTADRGAAFALTAGAGTSKVRSSQIASDLQATGTADVIIVPSAATVEARFRDSIRVPSAERSGLAADPVSHGIMSAAAELSRYFVAPTQDFSVRAGSGADTALSRRLTVSRNTPLMRVYPNLGVMLGTVTPEGLAGLNGHHAVREILGTPVMSLIRPPRVETEDLETIERARGARSEDAKESAAAALKLTWGLRRLGIPALWDKGLRGAGVLIGHLDTGVDAHHPALSGAVEYFARFDDTGDLDSTATQGFDSAWHGTHTAGTIAGRPVNGQAFGVAPEASLASAAVIEGGYVVARVLGGLDWAIGKGVRVLNLSLGLRKYTEDFLALIQLLRHRDILPVIAVGNEGPGTSRSPGNYAEALSVGALEEDGTMWADSSSFLFQRQVDPSVPDLVAPGGNVLSAMPGGSVGVSWGTSMASPHVAGLASLLWQAKPDATVDDIERAILSSCDRPAVLPADRAGRGVPDALKALEALVG